MSELVSALSIKPYLISITKSKKKFLYIGIILLIINFYFIVRYVGWALNGQLLGNYVVVFAIVNIPLSVVAVILLFVFELHKRHYSKLVYYFNDKILNIGRYNIKISDIEMFEIIEFYPDYYKIFIFLKSESKQFELSGISVSDLDRIKSWANYYNLSIN